ncbi:hypothetical protein CLG85_001660 [Yangia mangrovi]|uniref:Phage tail protein n=1 Tax=Alloyangia mangrovi TaxID=1779329 RepID=A0A2A3K0V7_9RHOB|nr:hypothetical protein [Alloyangia mangrovi]MCT4369116.1 hypothetical protein [Alloyangia mangrovi]
MSDSHIGATLYISTTLPATNNAAGFEALTWVQVNGLIQEPQLGKTDAMIDVPNLTTGFTKAVKGAGTGMDSQAQFEDVASDAGQTALIAAAQSYPGACAVKVGYGTGTDNALQSGDPVVYAQGIAHSHQRNQGTTTSYKGFQVGFRQNATAVEATEPA